MTAGSAMEIWHCYCAMKAGYQPVPRLSPFHSLQSVKAIFVLIAAPAIDQLVVQILLCAVLVVPPYLVGHLRMVLGKVYR